jgi:Ca2+:H+ antiporter
LQAIWQEISNCDRNAVELIVSIIALLKKEIIIVQTSLIGSMLSNLLLVMGMCFYFGGLGREQQFFNTTVAQTAASMLALAVGCLIIPTAYTWQAGFKAEDSNSDEELSRGTAVILLVVYIAFLIFQLKSHREMYNRPSQKVAKKKGSGNFKRKVKATMGSKDESPKSVKAAMANMGGIAGATTGGEFQRENRTAQDADSSSDDDEPEQPSLTFVGALITLCAATVLIGVNAEFLVDSISDVTCRYHVSEVFVGKPS